MIQKFYRNNFLDFNGSSSIVTVTDDAAIQNIFDGGGTVECWMNPRSDGESDAGRIFDKRHVIHVRAESGGNVGLRLTVDFNTTDGIWDTAVNIPINRWTHFAVVYDADADSNNPTIYINSVARTVGSGITETQSPSGTRVSDVASDLVIGNRAAADRTFDGRISNVRLWSDVRTAAEISANYRKLLVGDEAGLVGYWPMNDGSGGSIDDKTSNDNNGTASNHSWRNRMSPPMSMGASGLVGKPFVPITG